MLKTTTNNTSTPNTKSDYSITKSYTGFSACFSLFGKIGYSKSKPCSNCRPYYPGLASAELSLTSPDILDSSLSELNSGDNQSNLQLQAIYNSISAYQDPDRYSWFFFNRLIVPKDFKPAHASVLLMQEVADWADKSSVVIVDTLNPYGRLNLRGLQIFNKLFGFKQLRPTLMVRFPSL